MQCPQSHPSRTELHPLPDGGVCEGEEPGGEVPGDGGEGHVGQSRHSSAGRVIRDLH